MKTWFKKQLGDGILAHSPCMEIKDAFEKEYYPTKHISEMAVFIQQNSNTQLHCEVTACFSPATADLARVFNAELCNRPLPENLSLLAGEEESWKLIYLTKVEFPILGHMQTF